jgi:hypothetical protein
MKKLMTAAMAILIAFTSCKKDNLVGNGTVTTELRPVTGFSKVDVSGKTGVTINYGTSFKVEVKAYRNLLSSLETKVNGDVLTIGYKSGTSVSNDNSEVFITMPLLTKFSTTGDSKVNLNSGSANDFEAVITGASKIEGLGFTAKNATVTIEGTGTASFAVTDRLNAKITGSGILYYRGNPSVSSIVVGNGKVEKL